MYLRASGRSFWKPSSQPETQCYKLNVLDYFYLRKGQGACPQSVSPPPIMLIELMSSL